MITDNQYRKDIVQRLIDNKQVSLDEAFALLEKDGVEDILLQQYDLPDIPFFNFNPSTGTITSGFVTPTCSTSIYPTDIYSGLDYIVTSNN